MSTKQTTCDGPDGDKVLVGRVRPRPARRGRARRAWRGALQPSRPLRAELAPVANRLSSLDSEFAETPAPARVWSTARSAAVRRAASRLGGWWNTLLLWRSLAAGGVAVAAVAIGFSLMQPPPLDPRLFATQLVAALQAQEGFGVEFVAFYNAATGEVRLTASSGERSPDKDYELWYIKGDEPAVSMGVAPGRPALEIAARCREARAKFGRARCSPSPSSRRAARPPASPRARSWRWARPRRSGRQPTVLLHACDEVGKGSRPFSFIAPGPSKIL